MADLYLKIKPQTAQRLRKILGFYSSEEDFAQNIIDYQVSELRKGILNLRLDLQEFEEKYHWSTKEFYEQFSNGNTDDCEDYMLWAGTYEMLLKTEQRLSELI